MEDLRKIAEKEVLEEIRQEKIKKLKEQYKQELKNKRWWHNLFPFTVIIKIERRK
jgi:hypothetical protein